MPRRKVFVAVSGGVDSSTTAALLLQGGFDCEGIFMITHERAETAQADAEKVCRHLQIPLHILDLRKDFQRIIEYFCDIYQQGKTPNPCVLCNRLIKFDLLWDFARRRGADFLSTGHYAQIRQKDGRPALYQASNADKDQSYVLSMIHREMLDFILLPLADCSKEQTRRIAADFGLHTKHKEDSQEICFIPDRNYIAMLHQWRPDIGKPGPVLDTAGNVLGQHEGIFRYTIGQRRGLGIAGGSPLYVVRIDPQSNTVVLGGKEDLLGKKMRIHQINWLIDPPERPFSAKVKIRYNHAGVMAVVHPDCLMHTAEVIFDQPVSAITPGQAAVLYLADGQDWQVAGGGWIVEAIKGNEESQI
ncbi:MAG TPA: tRNA 2-thiouridine(34) synthase MnmA [Anaerohalosphaeraceae bacterium]|nr:tRNA 2-thiouridine(34) synthase MnmA [Anaerohalosphaeraceae bacterium]